MANDFKSTALLCPLALAPLMSITAEGHAGGGGRSTAWLVAITRPNRVRRRPPSVRGYRIFAAVVFMSVVAVDGWIDQTLSGSATVDVVGPASVIVWTLTLLGSFGVGPIAYLWALFFE